LIVVAHCDRGMIEEPNMEFSGRRKPGGRGSRRPVNGGVLREPAEQTD
jgi:hypothetical protein